MADQVLQALAGHPRQDRGPSALTQHQKRHLKSIVNMRSRVDAKEPWKKSPSPSVKSARNERSIERPYLSSFAQDKMRHENYLLANKIIDISRRGVRKEKLGNAFASMSRSLSSIVVSNRNRALKGIDKENADIFKRLVSAKPLYPTLEMRKFVASSNKYKSNILKAKGSSTFMQCTTSTTPSWQRPRSPPSTSSSLSGWLRKPEGQSHIYCIFITTKLICAYVFY